MFSCFKVSVGFYVFMMVWRSVGEDGIARGQDGGCRAATQQREREIKIHIYICVWLSVCVQTRMQHLRKPDGHLSLIKRENA